jgi:hypothetical protein
MADLPSPGDDHRSSPSERPPTFIEFMSETVGEDKRTKNLILIICTVAYFLVVALKGMHLLGNPVAWAPGGVVSGAYLVKIFVSVRRLREGRMISGDAADGKRPIPPPAEQTHSQTPQAHIPRQARKSTPQRRQHRKR